MLRTTGHGAARSRAERVARALILAALVVVPALAEARVGGGQSFGRSGGGGYSGGGGHYGGGGSGGGGDGLILLLQLVIAYPAVGIPVVLLVVGYFAFSAYSSANTSRVPRSVVRTNVARGGLGTPGLDALRERDRGFSRPVLVDFLVLVHRRAHEAIGNGQWDALRPFMTEDAERELKRGHAGVVEVSELVVGGVRLVRFQAQSNGSYDQLTVTFESTQLERPKDGATRRVDLKERWMLRRASGAISLAPERIERLGCPNCGASIEVTPMGTCRNCDTPITAGQLQWQASAVKVEGRLPAEVPEVGFAAGGDESSVHEPTLQDPDVSARMRELRARHPDFDLPVFVRRVDLVYARLQGAWSAGKWEDARPYVTDQLFQTLRFWVERYTRNDLRNQLEDVSLEKAVIVRVELDAWYEAVTVRLWGSMKDSVVDRSGKVVGGNARVARRFSEYWTFLRAAGTGGSSKGSVDQCPSCGAPLDRIDQAGLCGYCGAKITSGRFDWVLARIDQPEAYSG